MVPIYPGDTVRTSASTRRAGSIFPSTLISTWYLLCTHGSIADVAAPSTPGKDRNPSSIRTTRGVTYGCGLG